MESAQSSTKMLITGGSGFISLETIKQALESGHYVRTTIRSDKKKAIIQETLEAKGVDITNLSFIQADLLKDENWSEACKDMKIVLHIASPFPAASPLDEDELIKPAKEGTLRVLKAAKAAGIKKVVVTSSIAAVCFGVPWKGVILDETSFSDENGPEAGAYLRSKIFAERAVWEFYKSQDQDENGGKMEISVVNPAAVFGLPLIIPSESTTVGIIQQMLQGKMPAVPDLSFGVVDVRDVASLHLLAAFSEKANGERFIASTKTLSLAEIGKILQTLPDGQGKKAPTFTLPNWLTRAMAFVVPQLKGNIGGLGKVRNLSNEKAKSLGWQPRTEEEAVLSCAEALIKAGVV